MPTFTVSSCRGPMHNVIDAGHRGRSAYDLLQFGSDWYVWLTLCHHCSFVLSVAADSTSICAVWDEHVALAQTLVSYLPERAEVHLPNVAS